MYKDSERKCYAYKEYYKKNERMLDALSMKYRNKVFFRKGTLLERDDKVIIGCIAGEQAICFDLDIQIMDFQSMKDKRIGRVLPPYITRVQQKCASYMIREGVLPLPKELFSSFDI